MENVFTPPLRYSSRSCEYCLDVAATMGLNIPTDKQPMARATATGAIKEALFWDDLPDNDDDAIRQLDLVKADALAERFGTPS